MIETKNPVSQCHKCKEELVFDVKIGRRDMCPNCHSYLHSCKNCEYWDPNAHNQCVENRAEFIRDREEGNFCLYFTFKDSSDEQGDSSQDARAKLEAMFGGGDSKFAAPQTSEDAMDKLKKLFGD